MYYDLIAVVKRMAGSKIAGVILLALVLLAMPACVQAIPEGKAQSADDLLVSGGVSFGISGRGGTLGPIGYKPNGPGGSLGPIGC